MDKILLLLQLLTSFGGSPIFIVPVILVLVGASAKDLDYAIPIAGFIVLLLVVFSY